LLHGPKSTQKQNQQGLLNSISTSIFEGLGTKTGFPGVHQYAGADKIGFQAFEVYSELARDLLDPSRDGVSVGMDDTEGPIVKGMPVKWTTNAQELNDWIQLVN
jgi:hypothetical protein